MYLVLLPLFSKYTEKLKLLQQKKKKEKKKCGKIFFSSGNSRWLRRILLLLITSNTRNKALLKRGLSQHLINITWFVYQFSLNSTWEINKHLRNFL